jgi:hypothetical protein
MPKSAAFSELKDSLSIAQELLKIDKTYYSDPPKTHEQKPVQGLRGAASVFVVAAFERYLRNAIEEYLSKLTTIPSTMYHLLPDDIRINSAFRTLDYAMKGSPNKPSKTKKERLPDIKGACQKVLDDVVNPTAFNNTGGNPSSVTLKNLLKDIDVNDIYGTIRSGFISKWGDPIAQTFIPDKLDEIVQRRHYVAHTANALNISRSQLKESIRFIQILSELIDRILKKKIQELSTMVKSP